jgi:hypothetical protein
MAQAPDFQTILSPETYQGNPGAMVNRLAGAGDAASRASKAVGKNSAIKALSDIGKVGIEYNSQMKEIQKTEDLANVRAQLGEALNPLIQEAQGGSPTYKKQIADEAATYSEMLNKMPYLEGPEDPEVLNQGVSRIQGELDKRLSFLQRAKDQARMSPFTFEQEVKAITRKFISDNPALRDEIVKSAKTTLEDQGIIERLKEDMDFGKDAAKVYEDDVKFLRQSIKEAKIGESQFFNPRTGQWDLEGMRQASDIWRKAEAFAAAVKTDTDTNKYVSEDQKRAFVDSGAAPLITLGAYNDTLSKVAMVFQENAGNFPKAKLAAQTLISNDLVALRANPAFLQYSSVPEVKEAIENAEKQLVALQTNMNSFASGDDLEKYTTNTKTMMANSQQLQLMNVLNVPALEVVNKIGQTFPGLVSTKEGQSFMSNVIRKADRLFTDSKLQDATLFSPIPGSNTSAMAGMLGAAAGNAASGAPSSVDGLNKLIVGFVGGINDKTISTTPEQSYLRADEFIVESGKPTNKTAFANISPEAQTKYLDLLDDYNSQLEVSLQKYLTSNPNSQVKLTVNPSTGRLLVQGADAEFNNAFTSRIDASLKSYANLLGEDPKAVWQDFYQTYFPNVMTGKVPEKAASRNNPLNLKDASTGDFRSFKGLEEAVPAYEAQLLRYASGATDGKKRTTIKDIVDLWRPASDRRGEADISQENYYSRVAEYMEKSPRTPLDLNNKDVMAKLITAMSQVEGTPVNELRVRSFLKGSSKVKKENVVERVFDVEVDESAVEKKLKETKSKPKTDVVTDVFKNM